MCGRSHNIRYNIAAVPVPGFSQNFDNSRENECTFLFVVVNLLPLNKQRGKLYKINKFSDISLCMEFLWSVCAHTRMCRVEIVDYRLYKVYRYIQHKYISLLHPIKCYEFMIKYLKMQYTIFSIQLYTYIYSQCH